MKLCLYYFNKLFCVSVFSLVLCLLIVSCTNSNSINDEILKKDPKDIILEITAEFISDADILRGKVLYFRLYKDGYVKFDDYPNDSEDGIRIILEKMKTHKYTRISKEKLAELKNILASKEFQNLKNKYEKFVSSCDAVPKVDVKEGNKIIKITWCDSLTKPHDSPEFPDILQKLFQEIYEIKHNYLKKEISAI